MNTQVTTRVEFECCYIVGTELNAHRYRVEVSVDGPQRLEDLGAIIDFSELKNYVLSIVPDKTFVFDTSSRNPGRDVAFVMGQHSVKILAVSFPISAENLCNYIATMLQQVFNQNEPGVRVVNVKLRENNDSFVSWTPDKI